MRRLFRENGLSIVLASAFVAFWIGQSVAGHREYNDEQRQHGQQETTYRGYLGSAHFWEATTENWESEFFQIFFYVFLTAFLYQKGSAESKKLDEPEPVDRDPRTGKARADAPWPVRRGGIALKIYEHSLSLAFLLLFLMAITPARRVRGERLQSGANPTRPVPGIRARICRHIAVLVRILPELAERIPVDRPGRGAVDLPAPARVARVEAGGQPA
jgi:hypothetical protein